MWRLWIIFFITIFIGLWIDVVFLGKPEGKINDKSHGCILIVWIFLTMLFGLVTACLFGYDHALKFCTGYILELSLSIDNMFMFMSIFSYFHISYQAQNKALSYGIVGAIVMRLIFILTGITLLNNFNWLMPVFGCLLIFSAWGMFKSEKTKSRVDNLPSKIGAVLKIKQAGNELAFFATNGTRWCATPLLACVITIEIVDIIFALDSVPAVLSITKIPVLVYSSNIFAIMGLRSMYLQLVHLIDRFSLLKYGIGANLIFVGIKMMVSKIYHFSTILTLTIIISIFVGTILGSRLIGKFGQR